MAKPQNDPDRRHFAFFVYRQPSPLDQRSFSDMDFVIKCMHGKKSSLINKILIISQLPIVASL